MENAGSATSNCRRVSGRQFGQAEGWSQARQGLGLRNITKCCTEVCPAWIKINDNAIIAMKERSVAQRDEPLGRVLRSWRHREDSPPAE